MRSEGRDRGAAAVEFALVLLPLVLLVFGIIVFGRAFQIQSSLSMAAREGVRVATLTPGGGTAAISKGLDQAQATAQALGLQAAELEILSVGSSCTAAGQAARIEVSTDFDMFGLAGFFTEDDFITLTGGAEMRCGG